jgi:hypothetical protein
VAIETTRLQILICSLALCAAGCRRGAPDLAAFTEEEPSRPADTISVADPQITPQLISGWHQVELNSWRWTARRFSIVLGTPPGAAKRGAVLRLQFTLPDIVFSHFKAVTLSASIQGIRLAPETYRRVGPVTYQRDVPPAQLAGSSVLIDFTLDKAVPPGTVDTRERGLVANRVSLETK